MKHNLLEKLGVSIPQLGLGCMRLPTDNDTIDYAHAQKIVDYAMKNGVNYFDTAYMYHNGESQYFLGKALAKYPRESYFLTNKLPIWYCKEPADMEKIFQDQLQRCRTSYFDFYFMHSMNDEHWKMAKDLGLVEFMKQKKKEGSVKAIGFSFHGNLPLLEEMVEAAEWDFVQLQLNYLDWDKQNAKGFYEVLEKKGIPCFVMEPVRGGKLAALDADSEQQLHALRPNASIASFGFRWLQGLDNVHMVLSGMSDMAQMADNVATFEHLDPLSPAEEAILFAAADKMKNSIPCTACRYCCDGCPQQLDIPDLLHKYNQLRTGSGSTIKMQLDALPANKWPHACLGCGACAAVCPQKIVIPDELAAFAAELDKLPDWVEVCRQRAEAEARERASRGL